jgi:hypothetical protein
MYMPACVHLSLRRVVRVRVVLHTSSQSKTDFCTDGACVWFTGRVYVNAIAWGVDVLVLFRRTFHTINIDT